jgi:protein-S-isoprenylcysteine O-methyltransferase Ste14
MAVTAQGAVIWLWVVWYVTWIAAVVFSSRTKVQMGGADMGGWHRALASAGVVLLFTPARWTGPIGAPLWKAPALAQWLLLALVVAGFGFCWWARLHLGRLWSGLVTLKEGHHIVDTGPYGLVRHPIYTGVMFAALMTALIAASPAALLGFALVCLGFGMTARIEEGFLRDQLGAQAYDDYSRRTPMLIPKFG